MPEIACNAKAAKRAGEQSERGRTGVAHENARRRKVEHQKPEGGAGDNDGEEEEEDEGEEDDPEAWGMGAEDQDDGDDVDDDGEE